MKTKKYIIEIKLKREKFSRWYYDKKLGQIGFFNSEFVIESNEDEYIVYFKIKDIDYFRIIEQ